LEGRAFQRRDFPGVFFLRYHGYAKYFPLLGDGALPQSEKRQPASGAGGNVTASPVIAVTGLKTEARLVAGPRVYAIAGGGDAVGLTRALEAAVAKKASAIISFGVAGGLAPRLAPGSALIARAIISEDGTRYSSDPVWSKRLSSALGGAAIADIAGVDAPLAGHEEKHALHMKTGAHAADMESHIAARIAAAYKLPFAAYRVVADPADRRLPHAALVALKPDGSFALGAIAESILRDPSQIPQLLRIAHDAQAAFVALFRSRKLLARTFDFTDFREFLLDVPADDVIDGPLQV
jgi:adenosylhomocysteine nucleosidase